MWGPLTIVDKGQYWLVVPVADPEDWLARFDKQSAFPAHEWAARLVALYNAAPLGDRPVFIAERAPTTSAAYHPHATDSATARAVGSPPPPG